MHTCDIIGAAFTSGPPTTLFAGPGEEPRILMEKFGPSIPDGKRDQDMEIMNMSCPSCQAPLKIPNDLDRLTCGYCGSELVVKRTTDFATLNLVEEVSQTIQEVGNETQSTIREGTSVTQAELRRLQISQEISALQLQLTSVQSEIRTLEHMKKIGR